MSECMRFTVGQHVSTVRTNTCRNIGECIDTIGDHIDAAGHHLQNFIDRCQQKNADAKATLDAALTRSQGQQQTTGVTPTGQLQKKNRNAVHIPSMNLDTEKMKVIQEFSNHSIRPEQETVLAGHVKQLLNAPDHETLQQHREARLKFATAENTLAYAEAVTETVTQTCEAMSFTDTETLALDDGKMITYAERADGGALAITLQQTPGQPPVLSIETLNITDDTCHELVEEFTTRMQEKVTIHQPGRREATGGIAVLPATKRIQKRKNSDRAARTERKEWKDRQREQQKEQKRRQRQSRRRAIARRTR